MTDAGGQAVRQGAQQAGGALIRLGRVLLAVALLLCLAVAALAWRLSTGPLALPWLATRIARAASTPDRAVSIGGLALSWGGFGHPGEPPLGLHLANLDVRSGGTAIQVAQADIALPLGPLLTLDLAPSSVAISGMQVRLSAATATSSGQPASARPVDVAHLLRLITTPASGNGSERALAQLRHVHVHDVQVAATGVPAQLTRLEIDLDRDASGAATGTASALLEAAGQRATLTLAAHLAAEGGGTNVQARLTPVSPASLAGVEPQTAFLAALDAPVTLSASTELGPTLAVAHAELDVGVSAGTIHAGTGTAPLLGADLHLTYADERLQATLARLDMAPDGGADPARRTRFTGQATATREGGGFAVAARLGVDRLAFADLAALWPEGTGGKGARPWMTENLTAGELTDGHVALDLGLPGDLSDVSLKHVDAAIDGHDVTAHWLRPVPPLEHAEARLTATDPDVIDIAVASAEQAGGTHGGLAFHDATIHLTGIAGSEQYADIRTGLTGSLADLLAVLNNPRIKLLDKRPLPMRDPAGEVSAQIKVSHLPLRDAVTMEELAIETSGHYTGVHLGGIAAGYDLSDGTLDLTANNDGLATSGTATLAGFPSRLKIGMDFRTGPPTQVQETVDVHATVALARLAEFGIPVGRELGGTAELATTLESRRDGRMQIGLDADLTQATLSEPRMGLNKPAGTPGSATAKVALQGDRLISIDAIRVTAPGIDVQGEANIAAGRPNALRLDRMVIGRDTDAHGEIRLATATTPLFVHLSGSSVDLSPVLHAAPSAGAPGAGAPGAGAPGAGAPGAGAPSAAPTGAAAVGGTPWRANLKFDRVILDPRGALAAVTLTAESDGKVVKTLSLRGSATKPFRADIVPEPGGRRLTAEIADAGALVAAASGSDALIGGRLHVVGRWADRLDGRPLRGVAEMEDFRVRDAPSIGRVLQGLTVYGLAELAQGPGLGFSKLVAPFTLTGRVLELHDSQAFSASLGLTAKGQLDFGRRTADLNGTIVPAYFFNSLLGRVPWVGHLFTAEKGGGLFAADVAVRGPLDDLSVHVNPLSALTPGILRGLFGTNTPPARQ